MWCSLAAIRLPVAGAGLGPGEGLAGHRRHARHLSLPLVASAAGGVSGGGGREPKHPKNPDPHDLLNVDADSLASDPGDLGRVAEGVPLESKKPRKRRYSGAGKGEGGAGSKAGTHTHNDDPHRLLNVDADPMESDPGDVGRVAPGILEKYEHLDKMHKQEQGQGQQAGGGAAEGKGTGANEASEQGSAGAEGGRQGNAGAGESDMLKTDAPIAGETQHPGDPLPREERLEKE